MKKDIKKWARSKTKAELVDAIAELILESHETESAYMFNKVPYCQHNGECLVASDEGIDRWDIEDYE